jgi:hypothetical protein
MIKLRSTNFFSSLWVHSFHFFILVGAWVVWEVFSPPLELSPSPEWIGWGEGYVYPGGGGYEYDGGAWPPDEPPTWVGGYEYGGGAWPPDEPLTEGGGYVYSCNPRGYCSSYSASTVASTVFIQLWLQYNPNSMKMVFSTNEVGSFWVNLKVWIFELLGSVDHWA